MNNIYNILEHFLQKLISEGEQSLSLEEVCQFLYILSEERKIEKQDSYIQSLIDCILQKANFSYLGQTFQKNNNSCTEKEEVRCKKPQPQSRSKDLNYYNRIVLRPTADRILRHIHEESC